MGCHKSTKFTREDRVVDKALRSPFFDDLEEIGGAYEIKEFKQTVTIKRPCQRGIAVFQLTKLRMFEFYYDYLDKYFGRQGFELCYMDTDSFYLAMSGDSLDVIVGSEMKQAYEAERSPGLFKPEFVGTRGVWFTAIWYLVQNKANEKKYSCKGV